MRVSLRRDVLLVLVAWTLLHGSVRAQTNTGTIFGSVRDSTSAVVVAAEVTATHVDTNVTRSTTTDSEGQYALKFLPLGTYRLDVTAPGFKGFTQTGIVLEVNRQARVDPVIAVGDVAESLQIIGDAPLVETASVALGRTVNQQEVLNLPLVNRDVYSWLSLTAGVESSEQGNAFGYQEQRTLVNGSANAGIGSVNYLLDGGNNVAGLRGTGNPAPNPDAVQEFRVVTNSYSAEYGRYAGGVVDVVTKSGTNDVHGSLFEFFRDDRLNARRWTPGVSALKDPLERNQFGGTIGGPLKRNKTFVFFSYSGLRQETTIFKNTAVVPTARERSGDFSASGRKPTDPVTRQPFPGDTIPSSRFDPAAKAIMDEWIPTANLPGNFYEVQQARPFDTNEIQLKLDHSLGSTHRVSVSYFLTKGKDVDGLRGNLPWTDREFVWDQRNLNVGDTWIVDASTINQLQGTYVRNFGGRVNTPFRSLGDFGSKYQIQGPPALPRITVAGFFNLQTAISGPTAGSDYYQVRDVLSLTKGRHWIRVGGEVSLEKMIHDTTLDNYGTFDFDGSKTGNAFADYLLGLPRRMTQDAPVTKTDNGWYFGGFAQDDIRMGPQLTLNLGVRYDLQLPLTDPQNRKLTYVPGSQSQVVPTSLPFLLYPGDPGIARGIIGADKNNVSPRIGLAWDPRGNGQTAIRAAFGVFYGGISGNEWNGTADNQPFTVRQRFNDVKSLSDPYGNLPGGLSPFPYLYEGDSPRFLLPASVLGPDLSFVWPYSYQMNLAIQQQLRSSASVGVAYVGAIGRNLPIDVDFNYPVFGPGATTSNVDARRPIMPGTFSRIRTIQSILGSDYHGLQVTAEKRGRRLTAKAYYTFGKSMEDAELQDSSRAEVQNPNNLRAERARTVNDRRHNFVLSTIWNIDYLRSGGRPVRALLNGWTLSAIATLRSGEPFTVLAGQDRNVDGVGSDRADLLPGVDPTLSHSRSRQDLVDRWFNTAAFAMPALGADGNSPRHFIDGPGVRNIDMGVFRDLDVGGRFKLQLRVEMINAFNIVNLNNPGNDLNAPSTFGRIRTARRMREVQLGARLSF